MSTIASRPSQTNQERQQQWKLTAALLARLIVKDGLQVTNKSIYAIFGNLAPLPRTYNRKLAYVAGWTYCLSCKTATSLAGAGFVGTCRICETTIEQLEKATPYTKIYTVISELTLDIQPIFWYCFEQGLWNQTQRKEAPNEYLPENLE